MDGQVLAARPGILDDRGVDHADHLFQHVQFAQAGMALRHRQAVDLREVLVMDLLHVVQPEIDDADARLVQRGEHTAAAVAYLTIIPAIIFLLVAPYNRMPFVRFHAMQSLGLGLLWIVVLSVLSAITIIGWIILPFAELAFLAVWAYTVLQAYKGNWFKLPIIGNFAQAQSEKQF